MTGRAVFAVMGTMATFVISSRDVDRLGVAHIDQATAAARARLGTLEQRFSHFRDDSDIVRWLRGEPIAPESKVEIESVLRTCASLQAESAGVFDVRNPRTGKLDTAGYVKGYAIRQAAEVLLDHGVRDAVVGVGGDVHASGRATAERPWRVAIQDPGRSHAVVALVEIEDAAVATSGRAQRGDHIWTGRSASTVCSFTVVGPDIALADAYATIGFAMGEEGMDWVRERPGYRSLVVRADGSMLSDAELVHVRPG